MEAEILKFICANQGAVDTDYLVFNLGSGNSSSVTDIIYKGDKFVSCCPFGQPKIVVRTRLRLCRDKDCPGTCRGLHLCKNFLYSGSCRFTQSRRGCTFSHALDSAHNLELLKEHGLDGLSRAELCQLLLQSDERLLPSICHDYNNGAGEFGRCQDGHSCQRLHICEKYLNCDCKCPRAHDFYAQQPLNILWSKGVPDDLMPTLKSVYANIVALRYSRKGGDTSDKGKPLQQDGVPGQRGRGGHRGNWGNRGNRGFPILQHVPSSAHNFYDNFHLPPPLPSNNYAARGDNSNILAATSDTDASSVDGLDIKQRQHPNNILRGARGRGGSGNRGYRGIRGNRGFPGNRQRQQVPNSAGDFFDNLDLYTDSEPRGDNSNISAASSDTDASSVDGEKAKRRRNRNKTSRGARGRGGNRGNGGKQQPLQQSKSVSDILADIEGLDLYCDPAQSDLEQVMPLTTSAASDVTGAASDIVAVTTPDATSTSSGNDHNAKQPQNPLSDTSRDSSQGDKGGHQQLQPTQSTNDIPAAAKDVPNLSRSERPVRDKTEICVYFIKGHCRNDDNCLKAHVKMPYSWEVRVNNQWTAMPDNEAIEKDYCDPDRTYSSNYPPVHFDTMTCGPNTVRRLSTLNSLSNPNLVLTTEWLWYWEDQFGKWNTYASAGGGHSPADMDSTTLEQKFLVSNKDVVEFTAGSQSYSLSFQDMIQTNKQYGTKRVVRRRPRFVSVADVQAKKWRRPPGQAFFAEIPEYWDKTQIPQTGYKGITLQRSSEEFKLIESNFHKTMTGFDIIKAERIQNKTLWDRYQLEKIQRKAVHEGRDLTENLLFHGTDNKNVDAICRTNFDWRLCGTHATLYGKGSYFARDAEFSNRYTSDTHIKSMFVARVLVGDYTAGSSSYVVPPAKDSRGIILYDSCVDNIADPSIYVVFEKNQLYPEYLLQYRQNHTYGYQGRVYNPAPQPASPVYKLPSHPPSPSTPTKKPSDSCVIA